MPQPFDIIPLIGSENVPAMGGRAQKPITAIEMPVQPLTPNLGSSSRFGICSLGNVPEG